jgi:predicted DNA-binding transcriptional regulator YafY
VVFFNNRFYLKCYNEETKAWRTYRIDRMKDIEEGEVSGCHLPKEEKRDGFIIDMFEPEYYENVTLRVKRVLLDDMMEHFGEYASVSRYSDNGNSVNISVRIGINQRFYLWVMKYGDGIELLSPPKVRYEFLAEVRKMLGAYPDFSFQE